MRTVKKKTSLEKLETLGQSIWLDYIRRDLIANGELRRLIEEDGLSGMTSNPSIFEKAIAESHIYDQDIRDMALKKKDVKAIYEALSKRDVQNDADEFRSVYEKTNGKKTEIARKVRGQVAISSAKAAYQICKEIFGSNRFKKLADKGARVHGQQNRRGRLVQQGN